MRAFAVAAVLSVALVAGGSLAACSSDSSDSADRPLRVDLVDDAILSLESELGEPQRYYEINATPTLVNLFVAVEDDMVKPYVFLGGALVSTDPAPVEGGTTFTAETVEFDPDTVLSTIVAELPTSTLEVFAIEGGPDATVRYTVLVRSAAGGQLVVDVSGTGEVLGVDPQ